MDVHCPVMLHDTLLRCLTWQQSMPQPRGCLVICCCMLFLVSQASKARDAEVMQLHKASADTSAKLQKALESLTTAQASGGAWDQAITSQGL